MGTLETEAWTPCSRRAGAAPSYPFVIGTGRYRCNSARSSNFSGKAGNNNMFEASSNFKVLAQKFFKLRLNEAGL